MHTSNCVVCGAEFQHKQQRTKYCSNRCGAKASYERRRDAGTFIKKCTVYDSRCERCGADFQGAKVRGKPRRFCSATCSALAASAIPRTPEQLERPGRKRPRRQVFVQCEWCNALHTNAKFCSDDCRRTNADHRALAMRSPLRRAVAAGDHVAVLKVIQSRVAVDPLSGCWEWQGRIRNGYPFVRIGSRMQAVHRLVIEATHEAMLGNQAAHHVCANSTCVNPDHLQPVTHAENTAEMLSRHAYVQRIAELEAALADLCPGHPLLRVIKCA